MSDLDTGLDEEMETFAHLITGDDATSSDGEADERDMPSQEQPDESNSSESDTPEGVKEDETKEQDADKTAASDEGGSDKGADDGKGDKTSNEESDKSDADEVSATEWKPPETIPYEKFSGKAKALRQRERDLRKANKQLADLKKQNAAYEAQLEANKQQAESDDYELREVPDEFTPELLAKVREGDPDAIADHAALLQKKLEAGEQAHSDSQVDNDSIPAETWVDRVTNDAISDTLEGWQADNSDAGNARMDIAMQVEQSIASDPESQTLSADEIGKRLIEQTNVEINRQASAMADKQIADNKTDEEVIPDSLSDGGTNRTENVDYMNLEGQALIDALDAAELGE